MLETQSGPDHRHRAQQQRSAPVQAAGKREQSDQLVVRRVEPRSPHPGQDQRSRLGKRSTPEADPDSRSPCQRTKLLPKWHDCIPTMPARPRAATSADLARRNRTGIRAGDEPTRQAKSASRSGRSFGLHLIQVEDRRDQDMTQQSRRMKARLDPQPQVRRAIWRLGAPAARIKPTFPSVSRKNDARATLACSGHHDRRACRRGAGTGRPTSKITIPPASSCSATAQACCASAPKPAESV